MSQPIVFLHGWTMQGSIFDEIIDLLGPEARTAAPDLPGHGSAVEQPATLDACAQTLAAQLDKWPTAKPVVVGWSMGAAVAWRYIERFGTERIGGLMTVDMSPRMVPNDTWVEGLLRLSVENVDESVRRIRTNWPAVAQGISRNMFASAEGAPGFSRDQALALITSQNHAKMCQAWDELLDMDARAVIPKIDIPYYVCAGARSRVYAGSTSRWIEKNAPNATLTFFKDSGHSPHLEEPEQFAQLLANFARAVGCPRPEVAVSLP